MSLEKVVKDILQDIENLKATAIGSSDILDEIMNMSEELTLSDTLAVPGANLTQYIETITFTDVLSNTPQDTGTFLVGTARVGFADCA